MSQSDAESPAEWQYSEPAPIPLEREDVLEAAKLIADRICDSLQWLQQPPDDGALIRAIESISVGTSTVLIEEKLDNIAASIDQNTATMRAIGGVLVDLVEAVKGAKK